MARQRASQQAQAAFARVGTTRESPTAEPDDQQQATPRHHGAPAPEGHEAQVPGAHDFVSPRDGDATTSRRHRGPVAAEAVASTVRFDQEEAIAVDELVLVMRRAVGRRVDKSELVRALLRLTRDREDLRRDLATVLRDNEDV